MCAAGSAMLVHCKYRAHHGDYPPSLQSQQRPGDPCGLHSTTYQNFLQSYWAFKCSVLTVVRSVLLYNNLLLAVSFNCFCTSFTSLFAFIYAFYYHELGLHRLFDRLFARFFLSPEHTRCVGALFFFYFYCVQRVLLSCLELT